MEELAKERIEREAVDKGDDKGQKQKRRKKGTIGVGYINADGTRDKAELVEMCKKAEADVYFIDTKYQRKDNHFKALETDMREIAGREEERSTVELCTLDNQQWSDENRRDDHDSYRTNSQISHIHRRPEKTGKRSTCAHT
jgi:hypothetical protein